MSDHNTTMLETLAAATAAAKAAVRAMETQSTLLAQVAAEVQAAADARVAAPGCSDGPRTLSVPEAGKRYFNLSPNASYRAARRGDIPIVRINGRPRVPIAAVEALLRSAGSKGSRP